MGLCRPLGSEAPTPSAWLVRDLWTKTADQKRTAVALGHSMMTKSNSRSPIHIFYLLFGD
jgi:hypothetical protein